MMRCGVFRHQQRCGRKGRQREALADALLGGIADGDSLLFYRKDDQTALVGPDVLKARGFRLTLFDSMGR